MSGGGLHDDNDDGSCLCQPESWQVRPTSPTCANLCKMYAETGSIGHRLTAAAKLNNIINIMGDVSSLGDNYVWSGGNHVITQVLGLKELLLFESKPLASRLLLVCRARRRLR